MKIVFMGTPNIAAYSLETMLKDGFDISAVFTREDKPVGRKQVLTFPPVKQLAIKYNLPVFQPKTLKNEVTAQQVSDLAPDLIVVVAYGRILPKAVLDIPKYGCINLHVSLLPKYRGAAPIQWAVINGEKKTGVTIMQLDEGMDTGGVIAQQVIEILPEETAGELFEKVQQDGAKLLCKTIKEIEKGKAIVVPQIGGESYAPPLTKIIAKLDFSKNAEAINNLVRGCNPWPLAWFMCGGKRIKVVASALVPNQSGKAGEILGISPFVLACGNGAIELKEVVPEGSKQMSGAAWAAGRHFQLGDMFSGV